LGEQTIQKKYRGNYRLITTDNSLAELLWERIKDSVPQSVEEEGEVWEVVGLNECLRLSKYNDGDVFQSHVDACFRRSFVEKSMYTVNIYLNGNDDFQQGRTRFFDDNNSSTAAEYTVTPVAGLGLLFRQPPAARYLHDGEVVRCGEKYLLRSDVIYRKLIPLK